MERGIVLLRENVLLFALLLLLNISCRKTRAQIPHVCFLGPTLHYFQFMLLLPDPAVMDPVPFNILTRYVQWMKTVVASWESEVSKVIFKFTCEVSNIFNPAHIQDKPISSHCRRWSGRPHSGSPAPTSWYRLQRLWTTACTHVCFCTIRFPRPTYRVWSTSSTSRRPTWRIS